MSALDTIRLWGWQAVQWLLPMRWLAYRYVAHEDMRAFTVYCWVQAHWLGAEVRRDYRSQGLWPPKEDV